MEALRLAFHHLHRQLWILICPIMIDFISLFAGWRLIGWIGESRFSWRIILETGMPSISHLLNTPQLANQIEFLNNPGKLSLAWIIVVLILLATAYAQGGFISALHNITEGNPISLKLFIQGGFKHWLRFISLYVMLMLAKIAVTTVLVIMLGVAGAFVSLVFFAVVRILFIYLEFTIVVDNVSLDAALRRSRRYMKLSGLQTFPLILSIYLVSGALSVLIQWIWHPFMIMAGIAAYAYLMTACQLGLMITLCRVKGEYSPNPLHHVDTIDVKIVK